MVVALKVLLVLCPQVASSNEDHVLDWNRRTHKGGMVGSGVVGGKGSKEGKYNHVIGFERRSVYLREQGCNLKPIAYFIQATECC